MSTIPIYLDFLSPYAYLAWTRARRAGLALEPRPVLFSALLEHWGQLGPAEIPGKRVTTIRDVLRRSRRAGVELQWPPRHPFSTVAAARMVLAAAGTAPQQALVDELFVAGWGRGEAIDDAAVVEAIATRVGVAADRRADATSPAGKQRLRDANVEATNRGVFGVPTFVVDGELLWGDDQVETVLAIIAGHDVISRGDGADAVAGTPGLVRRRDRAASASAPAPAPAPAIGADLAPAIAANVAAIFARAPFITSLGIALTAIDVGRVSAALILRSDLLQQDGYAHAGVTIALADHTAGACAATHAADVDVLSINIESHMLAPAIGALLTCQATTLRAGRRIVVVEAEVHCTNAATPGDTVLVAKATVTLAVRPRTGKA